MKYLGHYIDNKLSALWKVSFCFFAFSKKQFEEAKTPDKKYTSLGAGLYCPTENSEMVIEMMNNIIKSGIAQDIADHGRTQIALRELANHEAWYTMDVESTMDSLRDYGIKKEDLIKLLYNRNHKIKNDYDELQTSV